MQKSDEIDGWFDFQHLYNKLVDNIPKNGTFVECGAWLGKSSAYLCDLVSERRPDINIYIVDSWQGSEDELTSTHKLATTHNIYELFLENMGNRKFTPIKAMSVDAAKQFNDNSLDVIFIDMCHTYECVKSDLDAWFPKLKSTGIMAGHDYSWAGVSKAVHEKFGRTTIQSMCGCWMYNYHEGEANG